MMEADTLRARVHREMRALEVGDTAHIECKSNQVSVIRNYVKHFLQWRENWTIRGGKFEAIRVEEGWIMVKRTG